MGIRTSICSQADLLNTYVNSSYDIVKRVYDSINNIDAVSQIVSGDTQIDPEDITTLADNIEAIATVAANIDSILGIAGGSNSVSSDYLSLETLGSAVNDPITGTCRIDLTKDPFNLTTTASIALFINGVLQAEGASYAYEMDGLTVVLTEQLNDDDIVTITNNNFISSTATPDVTDRQNIRLTVGTSSGIVLSASTTTVNLSTQTPSFTFTPTKNQLFVYINGIYQALGENYIEGTSGGYITIQEVLNAGDVIDIIKIV